MPEFNGVHNKSLNLFIDDLTIEKKIDVSYVCLDLKEIFSMKLIFSNQMVSNSLKSNLSYFDF